MPTNPKDALALVLVLLPGFISLGLAQYLTDLRLDNFTFFYTSVALSLLITAAAQVLAAVGARVSRLLRQSLPWKDSEKEPIVFWIERQQKKQIGADSYQRMINQHYPLGVSLVAGLSILLGIIIAYLYQSDAILRASTYLSPHAFKDSHFRPAHVVMSEPAEIVDQRDEAGDKFWLRVKMPDGQLVEGFPRYRTMGNEDFELFLNPACMINETDEATIVEPVRGPGVLLLQGSVETTTLLDERASQCCRRFFGVRHCGPCAHLRAKVCGSQNQCKDDSKCQSVQDVAASYEDAVEKDAAADAEDAVVVCLRHLQNEEAYPTCER